MSKKRTRKQKKLARHTLAYQPNIDATSLPLEAKISPKSTHQKSSPFITSIKVDQIMTRYIIKDLTKTAIFASSIFGLILYLNYFQ